MAVARLDVGNGLKATYLKCLKSLNAEEILELEEEQPRLNLFHA